MILKIRNIIYRLFFFSLLTANLCHAVQSENISLEGSGLTQNKITEKETVVLLHGLGRSASSMHRLQKTLHQKGFRTLNIQYCSRAFKIESLAEQIYNTSGLQRYLNQPHHRVHFVGYSMGGLVIRQLIHQYQPTNLGRVVLIGTPNQGSELADYGSRFVPTYFKKNYGIAGHQLKIKNNHWLDTLNQMPITYDLGVIAGDRAIEALGWVLLPKPNDGRVSVDSTKIAGMKDHIIFHTSHNWLASRSVICQKVSQFLKTGSF